MHRTRIKICGLTRAEDVDAAVSHGCDAVGFVFYPSSPRYVTPQAAALLAARTPPFVTRVGLFVNAEADAVRAVLSTTPLDLLQFHGDESEAQCAAWGLPYIKAARVRQGVDLLEFAARYRSAQGLLLDAWVEAWGGGGETFDWSLIPQQLPSPMVLAGGLNADNAATAIKRLRPWAVDVSSGVESAKGVKDADKIAAFMAAVRKADGE